MSKLYTVLVRHCAPKDSHDAIEALVIADDEAALRDWIDRAFNHDRWAGRQKSGETWTVYPDDGGDEHEEGVLDRMLRLRGDVNDDENDSLYEDAHYGVTLYGWDAGVAVLESQISVLLELGIVQDWRKPPEAPEPAAEPPTPSLTYQEAARRLDGCEYREEGSPELFAAMKAAGLVAVFGASDDLIEFRGAIDDDADAGTVYVTKAGLCANECDDWDCPYFREAMKAAATIKPTFGGRGFDWTYKTDIPHATFVVKEGAGDYCQGIVFALADVPSPVGG